MILSLHQISAPAIAANHDYVPRAVAIAGKAQQASAP
jgi:hypothetical protein